MKLKILRVELFIVLSAFFWSLGGFAYNGGTHPFTEIDPAGNYIIGGQFKSLVMVQGSSRAIELDGPVTGGFLDASHRAVICSDKAIYELNSTLSFQKRAESFKDLKCLSLDNNLAVFSDGKAWINDGQRFKAGSIHSLVHNFHDFFIFFRDGSISKLTSEGLFPLSGSVGALSEKSTLRMANNLIMRADETGVYRFVMKENVVQQKFRVPVNPCSDNERCGLSLALDESYVVSGYWGLWEGQGDSVRRLTNIPNLSREGGHSSVSHNKLGGKYLYLGDDDVDLGQLPDLDIALRSFSSNARRAVWVKGYHNQESFTWAAANGQTGSIIFQNHSDPLPDHWAAYENESIMETPLEASSQPAELLDVSGKKAFSSEYWWRDQMQLDLILKRLKDTPSRQVQVGVIDTGLSLDHPGLRDQIAINADEIPNNSIDDDDNGLVDDYLGYDFVHDDSIPEDEHGHGTHVSGLIAGKMPDGSSMGPASSFAKLIIAKGLGVGGRSNSLDLARAVTYAVNRKAEILNCSWGGGFATQVLRDVILYALSKGVIVMMSAGNSSLDLDKSMEFPKMIAGLTLVASSDEKQKKSSSSNFGKLTVDWAVPGDQMLSTTKDGQYGLMSGTSMANALSTGITALALSKGMDSPSIMMKRLCTSSTKLGWENRVECGLINPASYFGISNLNLTTHEE